MGGNGKHMSNIAKLITANVSRPTEHKYDIPKFNYADVSERSIKVQNYIKYDIEVKLGAQVYIDDLSLNEVNVIDRAVFNVRRAVIEEIFGEFRPLLNELSVEIYNRDFDKIKSLINSLYNKMFVEGLEE